MNVEPLSREAQQLLELERRTPSGRAPDVQALERVLSRLGAASAGGALGAATGAGGAALTTLGGKVLVGAGLLVAGALLGSGGTYLALRPHSVADWRAPELRASAPPEHELPSGPPAARPPGASVPEESGARDASPAASSRPQTSAPLEPSGRPPGGSRLPSAPAEALRAEQVLLETARSALMKAEPQAAQAALRRHEAEHPRGALVEEREALMIQGLVQLRQLAEAKSRAERFRRRYPGSIFMPVVDAALESPGDKTD